MVGKGVMVVHMRVKGKGEVEILKVVVNVLIVREGNAVNVVVVSGPIVVMVKVMV